VEPGERVFNGYPKEYANEDFRIDVCFLRGPILENMGDHPLLGPLR
jgi:hypothetical protein